MPLFVYSVYNITNYIFAMSSTDYTAMTVSEPGSEQMLKYEANSVETHQIGSQYGTSYDVVWELIEACGFKAENGLTVHNSNDFHLVKNAMIYALGKEQNMTEDVMVKNMFAGNIDMQNLLRKVQVITPDKFEDLQSNMLAYLQGEESTGTLRIAERDRWHNLDGTNAMNKQHMGRIIFHMLNTVNPKFVAEKKEQQERKEKFATNRNLAMTKIRSVTDTNALSSLQVEDSWDSETKTIFEEIKRTILSAEKAKEFLTDEVLEILKPLTEEDEKKQEILSKKQESVKGAFIGIYDGLLGDKKDRINQLRQKFNPNEVPENYALPRSISEIKKQFPDILFKDGFVDFSDDLDDESLIIIRKYIGSFDGVATVSPEAVKEVVDSGNEKAKKYIAWFSDFYLATVAANFDKDKLKQVEDMATLKMVFPNGDWHKNEKEVAAIILGGDAGTGKGALGLLTTSSGTEGAAGCGPRHKHLAGVSAVWDVARNAGKPNFHLLGSGIFPAQMIGHINSDKATALDGYPRDASQAAFLNNPIFPPHSVKFLQTYFGWDPDMSEGGSKRNFETTVLFRYLVNRAKDGFNQDEDGNIKFTGREDTFKEFSMANQKDTFAIRTFKDTVFGKLSGRKVTDVTFPELRNIANDLYDKGIRMKPNSRMMTFRKNTKQIGESLANAGNQSVDVVTITVDGLTPKQQYAYLISAAGGYELMARNMPGEIDEEKYKKGLAELAALEV